MIAVGGQESAYSVLRVVVELGQFRRPVGAEEHRLVDGCNMISQLKCLSARLGVLGREYAARGGAFKGGGPARQSFARASVVEGAADSKEARSAM